MTTRPGQVSIYLDRNKSIFRRRVAGETMSQIARDCGLSPARIRQIVNNERHRLASINRKDRVFMTAIAISQSLREMEGTP